MLSSHTGTRALLAVVISGAHALPHQINATVGSGFGVNYHISSEFSGFKHGELELMRDAFKVMRFDMKWEYIETTCGHYNFSKFDPILEALLAAGIRPYAILDYANKCYSSEDKKCSTTKCVAGYQSWAAAVAKHYSALGYAGRVSFTSTNEPDNDALGDVPASVDYEMTVAASKGFVDAGFDFTGGVTEGVDTEYLKGLMGMGVLDHVTALSTHPYTHHEPEKQLDGLRSLRILMDKNGGKHIKLLLDEWGYPFGGFPSGGVEEAAPLLPRTWLLCLAFDLNCDLGIFFDWEGTVDTNTLQPNELFRAARTFQRHIGPAERFDKLAQMNAPGASGLAEDVRFKHATYAARFKTDSANGTERRFAVWQSGDEDESNADGGFAEQGSSSVRIGTGESHFCWRVFDHLGHERRVKVCSDGNGEAVLEGVDGNPTYMTP